MFISRSIYGSAPGRILTAHIPFCLQCKDFETCSSNSQSGVPLNLADYINQNNLRLIRTVSILHKAKPYTHTHVHVHAHNHQPCRLQTRKTPAPQSHAKPGFPIIAREEKKRGKRKRKSLRTKSTSRRQPLQ